MKPRTARDVQPVMSLSRVALTPPDSLIISRISRVVSAALSDFTSADSVRLLVSGALLSVESLLIMVITLASLALPFLFVS
jgi:hypothetical protein